MLSGNRRLRNIRRKAKDREKELIKSTTMNNMKNFAAQQLTKKHMNEVSGGVSRRKYCKTLKMLMQGEYAREEWTPQEWENAGRALAEHCM